MNVRTWLAVSVYMVIVQAFVALKDGVGPHTGERRLKYGHFFAGTLYSSIPYTYIRLLFTFVLYKCCKHWLMADVL